MRVQIPMVFFYDIEIALQFLYHKKPSEGCGLVRFVSLRVQKFKLLRIIEKKGDHYDKC